jgi:alpha-N-arabinofuranosidase
LAQQAGGFVTRRRLARVGAVLVAVVLAAWGAAAVLLPPQAAQAGNMLANPGFEERAGSLPAGWTLEDRVRAKGTVSLVTVPVGSGTAALKLAPNGSNTADVLALNVGQGFTVGELRGRRLRLSAWLAAEGGATASFGAYVVNATGGILAEARLRRRADETAGVATGVLDVPDEGGAFLLVVVCQVEGRSGAAFFDDVLVEVTAASADVVGGGEPLSASVTVDASSVVRQIPRTLYGHNLQWTYGGNMIWDFRTGAFSEELIQLTRQLAPSLLRFPGGSFADFYHWRDGIGPQASRPETPHQPGDASSRHTFGTDEALEFAERVGGELLITVNAHTGSPEEAADWVRYVNGSRPGRVPFWEIGNEFYIKNDSPANAAIPPAEYVDRLLRFAAAMRAADPTIRLLGIGGENYGLYTSNFYPGWNREVLTRAGGTIDYLAVHNAYQPAVLENPATDVRTVYAAMLASPLLIRDNLKLVAEQIDEYAGSRDVRIAVTEWGPLFHFDPRSRWVDHTKTLGSALFVASTLKAFIESPKTEIANAFKLNEPGFMGWIGATTAKHLTSRPGPDQYRPTAPYYALQLYTRHFGDTLVASTTTGPTYDSVAVGMAAAVRNVPYLETVASRSADGQRLFLMIINKHFDSPITARFTLADFTPGKTGTAWMLTGAGIDAHTGTELPDGGPWARQAQDERNPQFAKGGPEAVRLTSRPLALGGAEFEFVFPPHSVTSLEIPGTLAASVETPAAPVTGGRTP